MTESEPELVEEYPHSCRIVREVASDGVETFHYEGPLGRVKSFHGEWQARLYADVHTVMGGFREEKTGERGVPPAVARGPQDVLMAYFASNPPMSVTWVARTFDLDEEEVRGHIENVRERAKQLRAEENADE